MSLVLAAAANNAAAQRRLTVTGRVVDQGGFGAIGAATVEITGHAAFVTGPSGSFVFEGVDAGQYVLRVEALGYARRAMALAISRDTTVVVALELAPILLDSLTVGARTVVVRGHVTERPEGAEMIHVAVVAGTGERTRTDAHGWFKFEKVPAGSEQEISVREMGYLPSRVDLIAEMDTALEIALDADSLARRMIAVQVSRLDARARSFRSPRFRPIERERILWMRTATILDVVRFWYGRGIDNVGCIVVDEVQNYNGLESLAMMYPEEVERIEAVFKDGGMMLRIYTRGFMAQMMTGSVDLPRPVYVPGIRPMCR